MDSSNFQHRCTLKLLKEELGFWHESIELYLNLAISLTDMMDVFKLPNIFPVSALRSFNNLPAYTGINIDYMQYRFMVF